MIAAALLPSPELERVLARLVSDCAFRIGFFADPSPALRRAGFHLAADEREALTASPLELLDAFADREASVAA